MFDVWPLNVLVLSFYIFTLNLIAKNYIDTKIKKSNNIYFNFIEQLKLKKNTFNKENWDKHTMSDLPNISDSN